MYLLMGLSRHNAQQSARDMHSDQPATRYLVSPFKPPRGHPGYSGLRTLGRIDRAIAGQKEPSGFRAPALMLEKELCVQGSAGDL